MLSHQAGHSGSLKSIIRNCTVWPTLFILNVSLLLNELTFIFLFGMQYLVLKLRNVYINDDPGLTLTYHMTRSNMVLYICILMGGIVRKSFSGEKLAENDQRDSEKLLTPGMELAVPVPGLCSCIRPLFSKIFSQTAWPIKVKCYVECPWEAGGVN